MSRMARQKRLEGSDLSQLFLSNGLAQLVDDWARDDVPVDARWPGTTKTTHNLLRYWFQRDADTPVRFYDCQQRAIETLVYIHEILKTPKGGHLRNLGDLYAAISPARVDEYEHISRAIEESDYLKLCFKMATGTGKTWVLQAALVWQYFNALWPEAKSGRYSDHFLVVAPGLVVLERLLDSFLGKKDAQGNRDSTSSDLARDLFIPPEWRAQFQLKILGPDDVNPSTTPEEGAFVLLLNWHKLAARDDRY